MLPSSGGRPGGEEGGASGDTTGTEIPKFSSCRGADDPADSGLAKSEANKRWSLDIWKGDVRYRRSR
jgi:hypothetical protein